MVITKALGDQMLCAWSVREKIYNAEFPAAALRNAARDAEPIITADALQAIQEAERKAREAQEKWDQGF